VQGFIEDTVEFSRRDAYEDHCTSFEILFIKLRSDGIDQHAKIEENIVKENSFFKMTIVLAYQYFSRDVMSQINILNLRGK